MTDRPDRLKTAFHSRWAGIAFMLVVVAIPLSFIAHRYVVGNARTRMVREICQTIRPGDDSDAVLRKVLQCAQYFPQVQVTRDAANRVSEIAIMSNPGYDYYFRVIDFVEDRVVDPWAPAHPDSRPATRKPEP